MITISAFKENLQNIKDDLSIKFSIECEIINNRYLRYSSGDIGFSIGFSNLKTQSGDKNQPGLSILIEFSDKRRIRVSIAEGENGNIIIELIHGNNNSFTHFFRPDYVEFDEIMEEFIISENSNYFQLNNVYPAHIYYKEFANYDDFISTIDFDKIISHINYDKNILEYLFSFYKKNVSIK